VKEERSVSHVTFLDWGGREGGWSDAGSLRSFMEIRDVISDFRRYRFILPPLHPLSRRFVTARDILVFKFLHAQHNAMCNANVVSRGFGKKYT